MNWLTFAVGAVLSWGVYGAMLHQGQTKLGSPMRALLCVGIAYFLIGVLVPVFTMMSQGQLDSRGWNSSGATFATVAGALGAIGAACIIFSFRAGGLPTYVMPIVFGGAPLVNVLYTMADAPAESRAESAALCRVSGDRGRRGDGACTSDRRRKPIARHRLKASRSAHSSLRPVPIANKCFAVRMKICPSDTAGELSV